MKFQIGDRVRLISDCADVRGMPNAEIPYGSTGVVVDIWQKNRYGVSFDECNAGHDCHGKLTGDKDSSGYYVSEFELELETAYVPDDTHLNIDALL